MPSPCITKQSLVRQRQVSAHHGDADGVADASGWRRAALRSHRPVRTQRAYRAEIVCPGQGPCAEGIARHGARRAAVPHRQQTLQLAPQVAPGASPPWDRWREQQHRRALLPVLLAQRGRARYRQERDHSRRRGPGLRRRRTRCPTGPMPDGPDAPGERPRGAGAATLTSAGGARARRLPAGSGAAAGGAPRARSAGSGIRSWEPPPLCPQGPPQRLLPGEQPGPPARRVTSKYAWARRARVLCRYQAS